MTARGKVTKIVWSRLRTLFIGDRIQGDPGRKSDRDFSRLAPIRGGQDIFGDLCCESADTSTDGMHASAQRVFAVSTMTTLPRRERQDATASAEIFSFSDFA